MRSRLLDEAKPVRLTFLEQLTYGMNCMELAFMGHNMVLTMQGMGLGGWFYTGLHPLSVLGAFAHEGIKGLGLRFLQDERWAVPNPVGLDGYYEGLCPPYYQDRRAALHTLFAPGAYLDTHASHMRRWHGDGQG